MDEPAGLGGSDVLAEPVGATTMGSPEKRSADRSRLSWIVAGLLIPLALIVTILGLTRPLRESSSETFDESIYLVLSMSVYRYNNFTNLSTPMCPPLPILLEYWLPALMVRSVPETPDWDWEVPSLIRQARLLTTVFIGLPLVLVVYTWLSRRRGWLVGALGGGLMALSPTVLTASSLATTDACFALFAILALLAIRRYQIQVSGWSYLLVGLALGLALASKQTAAILFPVVFLELLCKFPERKPGWTGIDFGLRIVFRATIRLAGLVGLAFFVDWACYRFGLAPRFGSSSCHTPIPIIVPMVANLFPNGEAIMDAVRQLRPPLAIDTFLGQMDHASRGHLAFLMGQHSFKGWWYFFPVALAIKSTPAELLLFAVTGFLALLPSSWRNPTRRLWLGSLIILIGAGIASSINIGHRYMLLCYPLIVLIAVDWLGELAVRRRIRGVVVGMVLVGWQVVSLAGIAPYYMAYFNGLCGGPSQGYRYLVDSSLDWGQDLPSLRLELESRDYRKVALSYFGLAKPSIYGLRWVDWLSDDSAVASCDWLAISATSYQGVYGKSISISKQFDALPSIRVGYSLFLYDLSDPRVRTVWESVRAAHR